MKRLFALALVALTLPAAALECMPKQADGTGSGAVMFGNAEGNVIMWRCPTGKVEHVVDFATSANKRVKLTEKPSDLKVLLLAKDVETGYYGGWGASKLPPLIAAAVEFATSEFVMPTTFARSGSISILI